MPVLLGHFGGPLWTHKDDGAWSIPKGEYTEAEEPLAAAKREFQEETGIEARGEFLPLKPIRQASGKIVTAWAFLGDCDHTTLVSNTFSMEWPPRSGKRMDFPEVDRADWFSLEVARRKILQAQVPLLDELEEKLKVEGKAKT